jgi:hypothetical protein
LLVADEVIDVFLPVLYFAVQKRRWRKLHGVGLFDGRAAVAGPHPAPSATGFMPRDGQGHGGATGH